MHKEQAPLDRVPMLIRGLRYAGLCVMYQDRALAVRMVENPFASWPSTAAILIAGDRAIFDTQTADRVIAAKKRVLEGGEPERLEVHLVSAGADCWYALNIEADVGARGLIRGIFVTSSDISEIKQREEVLKGLLSEVSHRSRNLLAIIQSILAHTVRLEGHPHDFATKFRGRIQSLALTQDIVTQANWRGAAFRHLVAAQLDPFAGVAKTDIKTSGRDAQLTPTAALHVGLALHELADNSATHGVLAAESGCISIGMDENDGGLNFTWLERHVKPVKPPSRPRFGSAVLSRALPQAVLGEARLDINSTGVDYSLHLPHVALT